MIQITLNPELIDTGSAAVRCWIKRAAVVSLDQKRLPADKTADCPSHSVDNALRASMLVRSC